MIDSGCTGSLPKSPSDEPPAEPKPDFCEFSPNLSTASAVKPSDSMLESYRSASQASDGPSSARRLVGVAAAACGAMVAAAVLLIVLASLAPGAPGVAALLAPAAMGGRSVPELASSFSAAAASQPATALILGFIACMALAELQVERLIAKAASCAFEVVLLLGSRGVRAARMRGGRAAIYMIVLGIALALLERVPRASAAPSHQAVAVATRMTKVLEPSPGASDLVIKSVLDDKYNCVYLGSKGSPAFLSPEDASSLTNAMLGGGGGAKNNPESLVIWDTGAGRVLVPDFKYAIPGTTRKNDTVISTVNGCTTPDSCCDVRIPFRITLADGGHKVASATFKGAIVAPTCPHVLLPGGSLAKSHGMGMVVQPWTGETRVILDNRRIGPPGSCVHLMNMGILVVPPPMTTSVGGAATAAAGVTSGGRGVTKKVGYETWHERVIHRADCNISNLWRCCSDVPEDVGKCVPTVKPPCDSCLGGNKKAKPPPKGSHAPAVDKCGHISFDCWSCSVPYRWGNQTKVFLIHDHYSRRNFVSLIKSEKECPRLLRNFVAMAKVDGVTVTHAHTDNALVFAAPGVNADTCRSVCEELGIKFSTCCPDVPRQNGVCERQWSTLGADCRACMRAAGATRNLWWDCMLHVCDVAARLPIDGAPDECGMSRWYGKKPRFSTVVRPWGCLCYPKIIHTQSKVHDQSVRCMHLGRSPDQPGWRCFDPVSGRIYTSPHVDFVETEFPGLTLSRAGSEQFVPSFAPDYNASARPAPGQVAPAAPGDPTTGAIQERGGGAVRGRSANSAARAAAGWACQPDLRAAALARGARACCVLRRGDGPDADALVA